MGDKSLSISFSPSTGSGGCLANAERRYVHLEQVQETINKNKTVTYAELSQMLARAKSGISAFTVLSEGACSYIYENNIFSTWFHFYVWPSSMDLPHTITASSGSVSVPEIVRIPTEFSVLFEMTDSVELDFILEDILYTRFETECYRADGSVIPGGVDVEINDYSTLCASEKFFGVVRVKGTKVGAKHKLTTTLTPYEEDSVVAAVETELRYIGDNAPFSYYNHPPTLGDTVIDQTWTLTFINSEVFNIKGDKLLQFDGGTINEDFNCKYFSIPKEIFSDTYDAGDYFTFKTVTTTDAESKWQYTDIVEWDSSDGDSLDVFEQGINLTGYSVTNLNVSVTAKWIGLDGEEKSEVLKLEVPQCVKDALEMCGDPSKATALTGLGSITSFTGGDPDDPSKKNATVYFSICTGDVLKVVES